jgi:hypothetical protein
MKCPDIDDTGSYGVRGTRQDCLTKIASNGIYWPPFSPTQHLVAHSRACCPPHPTRRSNIEEGNHHDPERTPNPGRCLARVTAVYPTGGLRYSASHPTSFAG